MIPIVNPEVPKWSVLEKDFKEIVNSKQLSTSKWTEKVEEEICRIHNCKFAVLTGSATGAFKIVLLAMKKIGYGFNSIKMQDFTWQSMKDIVEIYYNAEAKYSNIEYVDVNKETWLAEEPSEACLFIPNMTFGNCKTYKHKETIYDSTHCFGNSFCNGRGYGEILSFSPAKIITGCEGGAFITNNKKLYEKVKELRRYHNRISEFNACFLFHNIKNLDEEITKREVFDQFYENNLFLSWDTWQIDKSYYDYEPQTNVIVYVHPKVNSKIREQLGKLFRIKQRYKNTDPSNKNSAWIYKHMIMFPLIEDAKKCDELIKKISRIMK